MIKRIWDRRRRQKRHPEVIDPADHSKSRKRGRRRRHAATLLLGLSTIMPAPGAKLIYSSSAKAKSKIAVSGSSTKKDKASSIIFGPDKNPEVQLWLPSDFENESCETSVHTRSAAMIQPEDLMPAFSYSDIVYPVAMKYDVDWRLVAAVIQAESGFNPDAVSPVGAHGLMQLMPETAADYGVTMESIHDPAANIEAGVKHLKMLSDLYDGDIPLIAAAYNAGQGTVAKFDGVPPFEETRTYVERVVSYYNSFAA
jgi:soluble lytic murein transglycosylase-like protein